MSRHESDYYHIIYSLLQSINQNVTESEFQTIQSDDFKKISSDFIKKVNRQEDKENIETLSRLVFDLIQGHVSEEVVKIYLEKQFATKNHQLDEIISDLASNRDGKASSLITFEEGFSYPKLSIIITTYNRKEFLIQAINSLLVQDYPNIEITVIDDSSTDGTDFAMEKHFKNESRIIYMRKEVNCGPGNNRREAFKAHGDGEYVLFLDDDDYLIDTNYLSKAVNFHLHHSEISFVAANVLLEYTQKDQLKISNLGLNGIINKYDYLLNFEKEGYPKPVSTLTTVFKRSSLIEMDILNMNMVNDASIYLRSLLVGHAGIMESIAGVYRIHGNNITFNLSKEFLVENLVEKKILKRMAVEQYGFNQKEIDDWFQYTVYTTISYYFYNSAKEANDFKYVYDWIEENCPEIYKKLQQEFRFVLIKKRLLKFPAVQKLRKILKV